MMYRNKLVAVIKVDGKILRERGETVYIPFGSEYSIHFKNLHSTDAVVDVSIDGDDVLDNSRLVVRANGENSVEGFLRGDEVSHKFKFIEKTQEISDYRGDKISDGLIRIAFQFEAPKLIYPAMFRNNDYYPGTTRYASFNSSAIYGVSSDIQISANVNKEYDEGITVKGSASDQSFENVTIGTLESQVHTIVFQLKGETTTGEVVKQPISVKTKIRCETCGKYSIPKHKFCGGCGTSLVI